MTESKLDAEDFVKSLKDKFKAKIKSSDIEKKTLGLAKVETNDIWINVDKNSFRDIIKYVCDIHFPHLSGISGYKLDKNYELIYHFTLNFGEKLSEIPLNVSFDIPKSKPEMETICDLIPGALTAECEKQEIFGITVKGIPEESHLFLSKTNSKQNVAAKKNKESTDGHTEVKK